MAGAALPGRLSWQLAEVVGLVDETPRARSITLDVPDWPGHLPGQHVDVRLTAEDGYQAQRSYSIATPEDGDRVTITVERIDDGEVSPFLAGDLLEGDRIELRGPIGGYFVWEPGRGGPLQLVAGGSGLVPLMAMLRARVASADGEPARLLLSARSIDDVLYRSELERLAVDHDGIQVDLTLTRHQPPGWTGLSRRIDRDMLDQVAWAAGDAPLCFVCGPTGLVETVASTLVELGHRPDSVRTERFGPTGGPP